MVAKMAGAVLHPARHGLTIKPDNLSLSACSFSLSLPSGPSPSFWKQAGGKPCAGRVLGSCHARRGPAVPDSTLKPDLHISWASVAWGGGPG